MVVHFTCPTIFSVSHCCTVSTFHRPSQFVLKTERFRYVSVENRMWKYGQEVFFHLTYVEPKHQSDSHDQAGANDFQHLSGYFEYVDYLPYGTTLIVLNYCFDLMAINFNWSTQPWSIVQREISSTKLHRRLLTGSISHVHLLHTLHKSFCAFQLRFYLS